MNIDLDLLENACRMVCRRTDSPDLFDDMQSEVYLAIFEGKYENSKQGIVSCAWKFYRDSAKHFHISFDDIAIYSYDDVRLVNNGSSVYGNEKITKKFGGSTGLTTQGSKYCQRLVDPVYKMRSEGLYYREIGKILKITKSWACCQVTNTQHLPIVSTKIKLLALEGEKISRKRTNEKLKLRAIELISGTKNVNAKLTDKEVLNMRRLYKTGTSIKVFMEKYNMSRFPISCAINGTTWKHVSL